MAFPLSTQQLDVPGQNGGAEFLTLVSLEPKCALVTISAKQEVLTGMHPSAGDPSLVSLTLWRPTPGRTKSEQTCLEANKFQKKTLSESLSFFLSFVTCVETNKFGRVF